MVDVIETAKGFVPQVSLSTGVGVITWVIIAFILLIGIGVGVFLLVRRWQFKYKIVIFEKIGGRFEPTTRDRAMDFKLGRSGDRIFYMKKLRQYLPTPTLQVGRRTYWLFKRKDGELINFELEDLDEKSKRMGARFLDKEIRYARTQIFKGLDRRYEKYGFMEKYGLLMIGIGYFAIIGVMLWLCLDKFLDILSSLDGIVTRITDLENTLNIKLSAIDNICIGGSGTIPA